MNIFGMVGAGAIKFCQSVGHLSLFVFHTFWGIIRPPYYLKQVGKHLIHLGYFSLPVVALTALFSGMVLVLQSYTGFARFSSEGAVATVVVLSMTRELGPVLAGLMVTGRVGAAMAAEIGTMRVTDQIDALKTLATPPIRYLVVPRVLACLIALPLLVLVADILGVCGGYWVATLQLNMNSAQYLHQTVTHLQANDVISGLWKALCFGGIVSLMGCYHGYYARQGAAGVGVATTRAVVSASIMILFSNYILTALLFNT